LVAFTGESIPIRLFLSPYELTPTHHNINNKFSVKYFLNLVLVDEEDRRYFKQQEITMYRLQETSWTITIQRSIRFVDDSNKEDWWTLKNSQIQELVSKSCFSWVTWFGIQTYAWNSTVAMMYIDWSVIWYWRKYFLSVLDRLYRWECVVGGWMFIVVSLILWFSVICSALPHETTMSFFQLFWTNRIVDSYLLCLFMHWRPFLFFSILDLCNNALQKFEDPKWRLRLKRICFANGYLSWN
jgi:hypothetical protein